MSLAISARRTATGSVRRRPWRPAALALAVLAIVSAGCTTDTIVAPAHAIRPVMPEVFVTAQLVLENGCPLLDDATGKLLPIWPEGVNIRGTTMRLREAPVAEVGEIVRLGGRWVGLEDVADDLLAPLPVGCAGNGRVFWVQTFELQPPGGALEAGPAV